MVYVCESFHIKIESRQKAIALRPYANLRLYLNHMAPDNTVHAKGVARGHIL